MSSYQTQPAIPAPSGAEAKTLESRKISITLDRINGYEFRVRFGKESYEDLMMDEPPLGTDRGANASRVLAAAVGNCLSASLLFCFSKAHLNIQEMHTEASVHYVRNEQGKLRIGKIDVEIAPKFESEDSSRSQRCLELFEDYCVVTQSVRRGIDISVSVKTPKVSPPTD